MSYTQMFRDDVSIYQSPHGLVCANCYFGDNVDSHYRAESTQEMIDHLKVHQNIGHIMPADLIDRLLADDPLNYPTP